MVQKDIKTVVLQHRRQLLDSLVALAARGRKPSEEERYRIEAEQIIEQLEIAESMVENYDSGTKKYSSCKTAIEAITNYLSESGRPRSEDDIVRSVINGGFRGGVAGEGANVYRSMKNHLGGTGKFSGKLKYFGTMVGLYDWDDEKLKR